MGGRTLPPDDVDDAVGEDQVGRDGSLLVSTTPTSISPYSNSSLDGSSLKDVDEDVDDVVVPAGVGLNVPFDSGSSTGDKPQELLEYEDAPSSPSPGDSAVGDLAWLASFGISYSDPQPDLSAEMDDDLVIAHHSGDLGEGVDSSENDVNDEAIGDLYEDVNYSGRNVNEAVVSPDSSAGSGDHGEGDISGDGPFDVVPASGTFLRVDAIISGVRQPINRASIIIDDSQGDVLPDPLGRVQRGALPSSVGNTIYSLIC